MILLLKVLRPIRTLPCCKQLRYHFEQKSSEKLDLTYALTLPSPPAERVSDATLSDYFCVAVAITVFGSFLAETTENRSFLGTKDLLPPTVRFWLKDKACI